MLAIQKLWAIIKKCSFERVKKFQHLWFYFFRGQFWHTDIVIEEGKANVIKCGHLGQGYKGIICIIFCSFCVNL